MSDCIFCKIVHNELPSAKVYEDEHVLAFLDISQVTKGHTLVIPKLHIDDLFQMDSGTAERVFSPVPEIANAIKEAFHAEGMNLLNNNGAFAGQEVFHYHLHLIPRYDHTDGFAKTFISHQNDYSPADLQEIAAAVCNKIE